MVESLLSGLHVNRVTFERGQHTTFHPGRSALLRVNGVALGTSANCIRWSRRAST